MFTLIHTHTPLLWTHEIGTNLKPPASLKKHRQHQGNYTTNSLEKTPLGTGGATLSVFVVLETSPVQGANKTSFPVIILSHHTTPFHCYPPKLASPPWGMLSKPCKSQAEEPHRSKFTLLPSKRCWFEAP